MATIKATKSEPDDAAAIRTLEDRFAAAVNSGDIDAIMSNYIDDDSLFVFDVVPRREYRGAEAYRKAWEDYFLHFTGIPKLKIIDLSINAEGNIAFSHSFMNTKGVDTKGQPVDRTVRVTAGYRKIGSNWLIVHEHISVPVDLATGKAVLTGNA